MFINFYIVVLFCKIAPALNLANCWKMQKYFAQLAVPFVFYKINGVFRDYTPSSICYINSFLKIPVYKNNVLKKSFTCFRHFSQSSFNCKINNNSLISIDKFSYYLTGLIEGDGTIIVAKTEKTKSRINYPSIQIVFHLKDLPLALLIQKELRHGSLARKKGVNAYILTVNNFKGLLLLISLLNGKMRTPKIYSLYSLIDWYNSKNSSINIVKKELDKSPLVSTPWLSGFIEADGHFSVRTTLKTKYPRIECKFELVQRQVDHKGHNNVEFLKYIAKYLNTEVKKIRTYQQYPQYRVRTTNIKGNIALEKYLSDFPLFGSKHLDYLDWLKVVDLFKTGKFDHQLNMNNVLKIKLQMNDKRTIYLWDHLSKFYNLDR